MGLEKDHDKAIAEEDHDMDILEHWIHITIKKLHFLIMPSVIRQLLAIGLKVSKETKGKDNYGLCYDKAQRCSSDKGHIDSNLLDTI